MDAGAIAMTYAVGLTSWGARMHTKTWTLWSTTSRQCGSWNLAVLPGARWEMGGEVLRDVVGYCLGVAGAVDLQYAHAVFPRRAYGVFRE